MATERFTIDELARRAGVTTRNVRAYQERGLLPPPAKQGRVGYYDGGHLTRLRTIAELLERGFTLNSIRELLDAWSAGGDLGELLGLEQALVKPWSDEEPAVLTADELVDRFGADALDDASVRRAIELGLVAVEGDRFRVPSMRAVDAGAELVAAGVPLAAVLDEAEALQADVDRIAARFVALFTAHVWEPFAAAGMPADRLPQITELVERLRPVAAMSVLPALARAMERQVAASVEAQLGRR